MQAIIVTGGKQYNVKEGDVIYIEKLAAEAEQTVTFDQVLQLSTVLTPSSVPPQLQVLRLRLRC